MRALSKRFNEKLAPKYFGPHPIIKQVNAFVYKLAVPADCRIHPVFHASQLKKVVGNPAQVLPLHSTLADDLEWVVEPLQLKDTRGSGPDQLVLVKWKGLPDFESTGESARMIHQRFPEFQLEDKLNLMTGRDGRTPIMTYYHRKHRRLNKEEVNRSTERVYR